jgi:hypothetical protein
VIVANDEIAFPMAGLGSVVNQERPVVDGERRLLKPCRLRCRR